MEENGTMIIDLGLDVDLQELFVVDLVDDSRDEDASRRDSIEIVGEWRGLGSPSEPARSENAVDVKSEATKQFHARHSSENTALEEEPVPAIDALDQAEDDRLLMLLRDDHNLPWKSVAEEFSNRSGRPVAAPALQMRYNRLRGSSSRSGKPVRKAELTRSAGRAPVSKEPAGPAAYNVVQDSVDTDTESEGSIVHGPGDSVEATGASELRKYTDVPDTRVIAPPISIKAKTFHQHPDRARGVVLSNNPSLFPEKLPTECMDLISQWYQQGHDNLPCSTSSPVKILLKTSKGVPVVWKDGLSGEVLGARMYSLTGSLLSSGSSKERQVVVVRNKRSGPWIVGLHRLGENQSGTVHYRVWKGVQGDSDGYSEMDIHKVILRNQNTDSHRSAQDTIEVSESEGAEKLVPSDLPIDKYISDVLAEECSDEEHSDDTTEPSSGFTLKLRAKPGFCGNKWYDISGNPRTDNARRILAERDAAGSTDVIRVPKHTLTNNFQHREMKRLFKTQEVQKKNDTHSDKDDSAPQCSNCGRSTTKVQCHYPLTAYPLCHTCYHYRWRHGISRPCAPGMLSDLSVQNAGPSAENTNRRLTEPVSYETTDDSTEKEKGDILSGPRIKGNATQEAPKSAKAKLLPGKGNFPLRERGSDARLRSSTASKLAQPAAESLVPIEKTSSPRSRETNLHFINHATNTTVRQRSIASCDTIQKLFAQAIAGGVFPQTTLVGSRVLRIGFGSLSETMMIVEDDEDDMKALLDRVQGGESTVLEVRTVS